MPELPPPDIETSSANYAARFSGPAGRYLLDVQDASIEALISNYAYKCLLDVGGGHGQLLSLYTKLNMNVTIHGSNAQCFAGLPEAGIRSNCVISDIFSLPFANQSFDVVIAVRLISHLNDWPAAISEMCRVARSCVVIDYPSTRSLNALTPLLFKLKRSIEKNTRSYISFSHKQLEHVFASHGFFQLTEYKQFALPMVIHRILHGGAFPRAAEKAFRFIGITKLFGSPVTLKAERKSF